MSYKHASDKPLGDSIENIFKVVAFLFHILFRSRLYENVFILVILKVNVNPGKCFYFY